MVLRRHEDPPVYRERRRYANVVVFEDDPLPVGLHLDEQKLVVGAHLELLGCH